MGRSSIRGSSTASAPWSRRSSENSAHWWAARVTSTRFPKSGFHRSQSQRLRSSTTPPTITSAGARTPSARARSTMSASVPVTTRCPGQEARSTTATGVAGSRPPATRCSTTWGRVRMPMYTTRVPLARARAPQSSSGPAPPSRRRWPVTKVTDGAWSRWVRGNPAYTAAAEAEVTPGTTSKGMPSRARASASSPSRPNTAGSPPLSRTTSFPARARSIRAWLISAWVCWWTWPILPMGTRSASGGAQSSTRGCTRLSYTTASARPSTCRARRVTSPGSPGPAPTR